MSEMGAGGQGSSGPTAASSSDDRVLAFFCYAMLLLGPLSGGASSMIAFVICLLRKNKADALNGAHFRYQLKLFWLPVMALGVCVLLSMVAAMGGGVYAAGLGIGLVLIASFYSAIMAIVGMTRLHANRTIGKALPAPAAAT